MKIQARKEPEFKLQEYEVLAVELNKTIGLPDLDCKLLWALIATLGHVKFLEQKIETPSALVNPTTVSENHD